MSKQNKWYDAARHSASIPMATSNLIISCGAETEKNYFEGVVNFFKEQENNKLLQFYIVVDAVDPMSMANNALNITQKVEKENRCQIDHVWVVFDKDDFPNENFNNAISLISSLKYKTTKFHSLWSNQCFELWLLLHFINMQSAINREAYITKLEKYIKEKYMKNDKTIFGKIVVKNGDVKKAITYAKSLINNGIPPANNDPATKVYEFFEHFSKYLNLWS